MARYTIDLGEKIDSVLGNLAQSKETTKSDIIRRAVAYYAYLSREMDADPSRKVAITDAKDHVLKEIVLS